MYVCGCVTAHDVETSFHEHTIQIPKPQAFITTCGLGGYTKMATADHDHNYFIPLQTSGVY